MGKTSKITLTPEQEKWLTAHFKHTKNDEIGEIRSVQEEDRQDFAYYVAHGNNSVALDFVDWCNANHFDYRGLIEKGLALEAPEDMYKTE